MNALLALFVFLFLASPIFCDETLNAPTVPDCAVQCIAEVDSNAACSNNPQCLCTDPAIKEHVLTCVKRSCLPMDMLTTLNATAHACNAPLRDKRRQGNILTTALISVTLIIVGLRFLERIHYDSGVYVDDYIIIFCLVVDIANSLVRNYGLSPNGLGQDVWNLSAEQITSFLRFRYASNTLYVTGVYSIKLCLLLFYLRIFPGTTIRRLIWGTLIFATVCLVVFDIMALAQCRPVSYYWQGWDGLHDGHCIGIHALAWASAAVSIILDFWMLGLPLSQLVPLQMHWKRKLAVALMFGVGSFVTVVSILRLRFLVAYGNSINPTWDGFPTGYWSIIEINVAIWCACMPNLRLLLLRSFPSIVESSDSRLTSGRNPSSQLHNRSRGGNILADDSNGTPYVPAILRDGGLKGSSSTTELIELVQPNSNCKAPV